jgi:MFS family permease
VSLHALPELRALRALSPDGWVLFGTRVVRLFAYGWLAVVLALYLAALGLNEAQIGLLLSLTLAGDAVLALWVTSIADRVGRRRMLLASAGLLVLAGLVFSLTTNVVALLAAAVVGTISPSGGEVGPAGAIEQAALPQTAPDRDRTAIFAWYNLAGSVGTALGALGGGLLAQTLLQAGYFPLASYRAVLIGYALFGLALALLALRLSPAIEAPARGQGERDCA